MDRHVFNTRATAKLHANQGAEYLAVLVAIELAAQSQGRVYCPGNKTSNCSMTKNPPNGVSFSDLICIFAMSIEDLLVFYATPS